MLFGLPGNIRLFFYNGAADMRNGFDGLSGLVRNKLRQDPLSGDVFIFLNRKRTLIKLLVWDQSGFAIWHKRLERGTFEFPVVGSESQTFEISRQKLMLMLEGISLKSIKKRKRYSINNY
jgi:transposase